MFLWLFYSLMHFTNKFQDIKFFFLPLNIINYIYLVKNDLRVRGKTKFNISFAFYEILEPVLKFYTCEENK